MVVFSFKVNISLHLDSTGVCNEEDKLVKYSEAGVFVRVELLINSEKRETE